MAAVVREEEEDLVDGDEVVDVAEEARHVVAADIQRIDWPRRMRLNPRRDPRRSQVMKALLLKMKRARARSLA